MTRRFLPSVLMLTLMATAAEAHTGIGTAPSLIHGFAHPFGGLDHILAMVAVGLVAANLGGRALWLVPGTFIGMMAAGGMAGLNGLALPFVEIGIALSVIVLGSTVALHWSVPISAAIALVGFFAVFHGHAHGAEMPIAGSGLSYALGFTSATALLHAAGLGLGISSALARNYSRSLGQIGGGAMALAGVGILAGVL